MTDVPSTPAPPAADATMTPVENEEEVVKSKQRALEDGLIEFQKSGKRLSDMLPDDTYETYITRKFAESKGYQGQHLTNRMLQLLENSMEETRKSREDARATEAATMQFNMNKVEPLIKRLSHQHRGNVSYDEWMEAKRQMDYARIRSLTDRALVAASEEEAQQSQPQPTAMEVEQLRLRKEAAASEERAANAQMQLLKAQQAQQDRQALEDKGKQIAQNVYMQRREQQYPAAAAPREVERPPPPAAVEQHVNRVASKRLNPVYHARVNHLQLAPEYRPSDKYRSNAHGAYQYTAGMVAASDEDLYDRYDPKDEEGWEKTNYMTHEMNRAMEIAGNYSKQYTALWEPASVTPKFLSRDTLPPQRLERLRNCYDGPEGHHMRMLEPLRMHNMRQAAMKQQLRRGRLG